MLKTIREMERNSHLAMYSNDPLYKESGWLQRPVKTVLELFPYFQDYSELKVLDLGCGIGRNCISIAKHFSKINCIIDCVDILDFAIEKVEDNAGKYSVSQSIHGIVKPIEDFRIPEEYYDWIIAVSALEHVDSKNTFEEKLVEIRNGVRKNGIVCLIINSNVREFQKATGTETPPQFEVNLTTEELQNLLNQLFADWNILKSTVREQKYDIPRGDRIFELNTDVVTFVAMNGRRI